MIADDDPGPPERSVAFDVNDLDDDVIEDEDFEPFLE